ncbi:MAG: cell division protein FtsL [Coxiellaceae bacterium]|nr:cell division protein FtsL [Coxiellaceae bacterium]
MNTATRVYGRNYAARKANTWSFSLKQVGVSLLALGLLLSAFGVVYAKDLNRRLFIQYQGLQREAQGYQVQWSKLLLEQGAWSTQSRIQRLAQKQLNMVIPTSRKVVFVEDERETFADNE